MKNILIVSVLTAVITMSFSCGNEKTEEKAANTDSLTVAKPKPQHKPAAQDTAIPVNGIYEKKFDNGQVSIRGEMRNGKREGAWFSYYENGQLWSQGEYSNGMRNGKSVSWHPNGKMRFEGVYTNDKQTGIWKYYTEDGKLEKEVDHDNEK